MSPETPYQLAITATARRQLAEQLPEAIAFAAHEFITGPLLANPHRIGKQPVPPLDDRHSARLVAGGGIVADSDPLAELAETQAKFQAMLGAIVRP